MHVVDDVECIDIHVCLPLHHIHEFAVHIVIVKHIACDRAVLRTNLLLCNLIHTAVQRVEQALCKVCTSAEELHFLADDHGRYAACDTIVITVCHSHQVVVLILDRRSLDRHLSAVSLPVLRKSCGPEYCQVRLRAWSEVCQCVQVAEGHLCHHRTSVNADTAEGLCYPYRIACKDLVVLRCTCKFDQTQLHDEVVNELLDLLLCECSVLQVSLCVAVKECRCTSKGHSSTVLLLN